MSSNAALVWLLRRERDRLVGEANQADETRRRAIAELRDMANRFGAPAIGQIRVEGGRVVVVEAPAPGQHTG